MHDNVKPAEDSPNNVSDPICQTTTKEIPAEKKRKCPK